MRIVFYLLILNKPKYDFKIEEKHYMCRML